MKVWYDSEFLEDGKTIELISIGMVREDGLEYYAVNADMDFEQVLAHPWLAENVVPHLPVVEGVHLDLESPDVKHKRIIRNEVETFLADAAVKSGADQNLELWSWYGAYDYAALCQLWGPMVSKPFFIPHYTNDIKQEFARCGNPTPPKQDGAEHNALADAYYHQKLYNYIMQIQQDMFKEAVLEALHPEIGHWCDLDNLHIGKN